MEHFGEFIDYDEGREDPREPFFEIGEPCESCGEPVAERRPATWDASLSVGECCFNHPATIDDPVCPELARLFDLCETAGEVQDAFKLHKLTCPTCGAVRKGAGSGSSGAPEQGACSVMPLATQQEANFAIAQALAAQEDIELLLVLQESGVSTEQAELIFHTEVN